LSASRSGYENVTVDFTVSCQKEIAQPPKPPSNPGETPLLTLNVIVKETDYNNDGTANVKILVQDYTNRSIANATVTVTGSDVTYITGNDGTVTLANVKDGSYVATASKKGYSQDQTDFAIKFTVTKEPAQQPTTPPVSGGETLVYSVPYIPILIILAILMILFLLWKRRKKKEQVDEGQVKGQKPAK
jgi:hypothetical protein